MPLSSSTVHHPFASFHSHFLLTLMLKSSLRLGGALYYKETNRQIVRKQTCPWLHDLFESSRVVVSRVPSPQPLRLSTESFNQVARNGTHAVRCVPHTYAR
uniref:Uncharacterized protein n=1 Tax=Anopheles darlingi TaxID=43151 RepID=A0A2M4DG85_ANODA